MKITTKLTTLSLGLALPFCIVSCKDAEKKVADVADAAAENVSSVTELPTDAKGIATAVITQMDEIADCLAKVTDLESAKAAIPDLEKIGAVMSKLREKGDALGGDKIMDEVIEQNPEIKAKFGGFEKKMMGTITKLKTTSPEAAEFLLEKLATIMGE
ncbi:MAG: hypothetical protein ACJAR1_001581 [Rubritalea sp.]|jgi:hypothetical protein